MTSIRKWPIDLGMVTVIPIPTDGGVVHVGLDPFGVPCVWTRGDQNNQRRVAMQIIGTGWEFDGGEHVGSFVDGPFVWHVIQTDAP